MFSLWPVVFLHFGLLLSLRTLWVELIGCMLSDLGHLYVDFSLCDII